MRILVITFLLILSNTSSAGWHTGKVSYIGVGYDGATITLKIEGWSRSDCTCYSSWPSHMCLDNTRETKKFEEALILTTRAKQMPIKVHLDEATCKINSVVESN